MKTENSKDNSQMPLHDEGQTDPGLLYRIYDWLYRLSVSMKTSLAFLAVFGILFFLGTVFPQSSDPDRLEQYREAGGKMIALVDAFDLLNIFRSRYFGVITLLFVLHLLLCAIHRLRFLRRRTPIRLFSSRDLLRSGSSFAVVCSQQAFGADIEKVLRRIGFKRRKYYSEDARATRIVCEKGLPYRWLSWLYHICILTSIIGFALSYLFAFENYLALEVGETTSVSVRSDDTNWHKLMERLDRRVQPNSREIELRLDNFISEHTEKLKLIYPAEAINRLSAAWGLGGQSVYYEMPDNPLYPRDWFSEISVLENGMLVKDKKIEVNDPLRYAGLTFYQMGYEYSFDLRAGEEIIEGITAGSPFTIPQMEGEFRIRSPRIGILFRYDGTVEKLTPSADLQHRPPSEKEKSEWATAGTLPIGDPTEIMRVGMVLDNLREGSVLSYRFDPGVPLLWIAGMGLVILMTARIYLPWYQLRCHVNVSDDHARVTVSIRMMGLLARPERVQQRLARALKGRVER
jgi:cytochrome c biogenesis protein